MKALVKSKSEVGVWLEDVEKPTISADEVLIKITKTAICGTDIHIYNWDEWARANVPVPLTIGHEFSGIIEEVGANVTHLQKGMRVSGEGHLVCGHCRNCRAGARHLCRETKGIGYHKPGVFAEFAKFPESNVIVLPDNIDDNHGAILDPLGNAVHTALSFPLVGEDVLITGAGPVGLMAAAVCRHAGAKNVVITDVNDYRLSLAKACNVTRAVNVSKEKLPKIMQELNIVEGFDVCLEMSGNIKAFNDMLEVANHGGKVALLGILPKDSGIDWNQVIFKCLTVQGIYGRKMYETWYLMMSMLQSGLDLSALITHEFHYTEYEDAFNAMLSGKSGKVILNWS